MAMPIVTGRQMADLDRIAIEEQGIPGLDLMERAGSSAAAWIASHAPEPWQNEIAIVAGAGNNGGDGFVIARMLLEEGLSVQTFLIGDPQRVRGDAAVNLQRLQSMGHRLRVIDPDGDTMTRETLGQPSLIVDALLGTGLAGRPRAPQAAAITAMLEQYDRAAVVAVDVPSGVVANDGSVPGSAVRADHTFTFGLPKIGHFVPPGQECTGYLHVCDIGFPPDLLAKAETDAYLVSGSDVQNALPRWGTSTHKGDRGRLLIVAGSRGMSGAAILAARAAVASGTGLVTLALPESCQAIAATAVWEALTLPLPETSSGAIAAEALPILLKAAATANAVAIGPGLGREAETGKVVRGLVLEVEAPILVDADGLWALRPEHLAARKKPSLLTPHPGELARLLKFESPAQVQKDRWAVAKQAAEACETTVLLKGAGTVTASPGSPLLVNPTGNSALATGGTGDVLSGLAGALLAQGMETRATGACAAYLHGAAADRLADGGRTTLAASELVEPLASVLGGMSGARPWKRERIPGDTPVI